MENAIVCRHPLLKIKAITMLVIEDIVAVTEPPSGDQPFGGFALSGVRRVSFKSQNKNIACRLRYVKKKSFHSKMSQTGFI